MIVKKKRSSFANGRSRKDWSRFGVVLTKEMQGGNINACRPRNEGLPQKIQTQHRDTLN